ncbi:KGG domain-containing protein [Nitrospirillum amazonense]|uniref:KGG domain-containing protein n=1 Tax=Nitrospirillum amazonense TaxID=28077 RepID=UPI0011A25488
MDYFSRAICAPGGVLPCSAGAGAGRALQGIFGATHAFLPERASEAGWKGGEASHGHR